MICQGEQEPSWRAGRREATEGQAGEVGGQVPTGWKPQRGPGGTEGLHGAGTFPQYPSHFCSQEFARS